MTSWRFDSDRHRPHHVATETCSGRNLRQRNPRRQRGVAKTPSSQDTASPWQRSSKETYDVVGGRSRWVDTPGTASDPGSRQGHLRPQGRHRPDHYTRSRGDSIRVFPCSGAGLPRIAHQRPAAQKPRSIANDAKQRSERLAGESGRSSSASSARSRYDSATRTV